MRVIQQSLVCAVFLLTSVAYGEQRPQRGRAKPAEVDQVWIDKSERRMELRRNGLAVRSYIIALGPEPVGHKEQEGDGRTPEGRYEIVSRNSKSAFHRSLRISYPNAADRRRAAARGVSPGGDIMIHGLPNGFVASVGSAHRFRDWTAGCVAVTNEEIEEIWKLVPDGTPVLIQP